MDPNISRKPAACVAARPMAQIICCSRQADQFADSDRGTEHAGRSGDVPADVVMRGINGVADARFGFESEDERVHEIAAADFVGAGISEERRGHRRTGVNIILRRGVVVIVDMGADAVHQRGVQRIDAFGASENACGRAGRRTARTRTWRLFTAGVGAATERASHVVQKWRGATRDARRREYLRYWLFTIQEARALVSDMVKVKRTRTAIRCYWDSDR